MKLILCLALGCCVYSLDIKTALLKSSPLAVAELKPAWNKMAADVAFSFLNDNVRYAQDRIPQTAISNTKTLTAWKGEKVHAQLGIWSKIPLAEVKIGLSALKGQNNRMIPATAISAGFVGYVMTDEFRNGCGYRKPQDFDSSLVADPINLLVKGVAVKPNTVQPVWVSITVPPLTPAGLYEGTITLSADKMYTGRLSVRVLDKTLPPPSQWNFNLDLWQHPAAIARIHGTPLWSPAHFEFMRKYYTMLANAGQKNITASIVNEPWGHQTYDDFPGLIKWTKKRNNTWEYDYKIFDKYIAFVMSCGINQRINCYSMIPWKIAFQYYDEALGKDTVFTGKIGSPEYNEFWRTMLTDFTRHLKSKGWFNITAISMDERPMPAMQTVIKLLKEIDKDWKVALAGDYHPEIEADVYDYCIASHWQFPSAVLNQRQARGQLSTWYTCCTEKYPNGFTFSPPAEHVWIGWYTAAKNMNGYLRWAFNSWPKDPVRDSRFTAWPAGDTYQVYPGPMTCIRFEKLIEGVQDFEKISFLRKEYRANHNDAKLRALDDALATFNIDNLSKESAEARVVASKKLLNEL